MEKEEKDFIEWVSTKYNRSTNQTKELFNLCDNQPFKLMRLENTIKEKFIKYCPADEKTINEILNTPTLAEFTEKVTKEAKELYPLLPVRVFANMGANSEALTKREAHIKARLMGFEESK
jgi:hypothetical protein